MTLQTNIKGYYTVLQRITLYT